MRETAISCLSHAPQLGTWPTTQACTLTETRTHDLSLCGMMLCSLSHISQGHTSILSPSSVTDKIPESGQQQKIRADVLTLEAAPRPGSPALVLGSRSRRRAAGGGGGNWSPGPQVPGPSSENVPEGQVTWRLAF